MHITSHQLSIIENALLLQAEWDKALEAIKEVRENVASDAMIALAQDRYGSDDVEIDDDAGTSPSDEGCWVSAWVWLRKPTVECKRCAGLGSVSHIKGAQAPDGDLDYFQTHTCPDCDGDGEIIQEFE